MEICLSILEFEEELSREVDNLEDLKSVGLTRQLLNSSMIHRLHLDIMRSSLVPDKTIYSEKLLERIYTLFNSITLFEFHLMTRYPLSLMEAMNRFIDAKQREQTYIILQKEIFRSIKELTTVIKRVKEFGYSVGLCFDLPTPLSAFSKSIISNLGMVLLMAVPMGKGGQIFNLNTLDKIKKASVTYPQVPIFVDGGVNDDNLTAIQKAGASGVIIGSYITRSKDPESVLETLYRKS